VLRYARAFLRPRERDLSELWAEVYIAQILLEKGVEDYIAPYVVKKRLEDV